jgi:hypothetical protein
MGISERVQKLSPKSNFFTIFGAGKKNPEKCSWITPT